MKLANTLRTLAAACALAVASQAGAAVLQVNSNGILTGATGVNVGGTFYDVTFADGSCNSLFNGCVQSEFAFKTVSDGSLAAQALLDQVFIDGPVGQFDSIPESLGCTTGTQLCITLIPYSVLPPISVQLTASRNVLGAGNGFNRAEQVRLENFVDTVSINHMNYAIFQLAAPTAVPEPTSIALFGLALAGLAFNRRRKA